MAAHHHQHGRHEQQQSVSAERLLSLSGFVLQLSLCRRAFKRSIITESGVLFHPGAIVYLSARMCYLCLSQCH